MKQLFLTRAIPLLSVFSAFSFVVMMFNLPLPGGTTGHAVGVGMAAIVLGPWVSIVAISTALLIQALLFGDGGITAYGANCFNMAIVGSIAAYLVYRLIAGSAALQSRRRIIAAGLAGYVAINCSALCAAIEFGIQPILFHDASGAPLYAPYPLAISVPAMMIGHLTFAGLAELILSAGIVSYLGRNEPALLRATAPGAPESERSSDGSVRLRHKSWASSRKLWAIVAAFIVLTPLGIVAAGSAWGEWKASDFESPGARAAIAAASRGHVAPSHAPSGFARLARLWTAPMSNYTPSFVQNVNAGYIVSAAIGVIAIALFVLVSARVFSLLKPGSRVPGSFVERSLASLMRVSEEALFAESIARRNAVLQRLDPRAKLAGACAIVIAAISVHRLMLVAGLFACTALLVIVARIPLRRTAAQVWVAVLTFTAVVALPAVFLIHGRVVALIPVLGWEITAQGLRTAAFLLLRSETAATAVLIAVATTPWHRMLRALRVLRVPASAVVIFEMTYRYVFVFLEAAADLFEARRTRLFSPPDAGRQRSSATSLAGALLERSFSLSSEVHMAMQARGFRGDVRLLQDLAMGSSDWIQLAFILAVCTLAVWVDR